MRAQTSLLSVLYNADMSNGAWTEERLGETAAFRPSPPPAEILVAVSSRGVAPEGPASPTAFLSRRFAQALGLPQIPIVRARQVHGNGVAQITVTPEPGVVFDAGECDILVTAQPGVALAVQTADCVAVLVAGPGAIAAAHAGWRGSAKNAAGTAVEELLRLGLSPRVLRAWLGPSIGRCCYEVGGEVAGRFSGKFARRSRAGRLLLDLPAVNRSQLVDAGVPAENISTHPACTRCGGEKFASYRRDGSAAGRMIALVARF